MALPTSVTVEVEFTAGVWTDVSSTVNGKEGVAIRRGRSSRADESQPGTASFVLDNDTGNFTPDNPLSAYWPNVVEGKAVRVKVTKGTTSQRFIGKVSEWTPDFTDPDPAKAKTRVTAADCLADAARFTMLSAARGEVLADTPTAYWPLDDAAGASGATSGISGGPSLERVQVGTGGSAVAGEDAIDLSPAWMFTAASAGNYVGLTETTPLPNDCLTLEAWFRGTSTAVSQTVAAVIPAVSGNNDSLGLVVASTTGVAIGRFYSAAGLATYDATGASVTDGRWHHLAVTLSGGNVNVFVDGVKTSAAYGAGYTAVPRNVYVARQTNGSVAHVAYHATALSDARIAARRKAVLSTSGNGTLAERWTAVAAFAGLTAAVDTTWPDRNAAALPVTGKTALAALQDVIRAESGVMYASPTTASTVVGRARTSIRSATVALTLDVEADGTGGLVTSRSQQGKASRVDADNGLFTVSRSDSSITDGGAVTLTVPLAAVDEVAAVATDRLAASRWNRLGVPKVTLDLMTASNDRYSAVFALLLGDRLRLSGLPSTQIGWTYFDVYVEGWTERWGTDGATVEFDVSPADAPAENLLDDANLGRVCADGTMTLTSGITSTATSIQVTTSAGPLLTTDAAAYPLDLDVNGERVTVASAPGGTSPQTVTVTRGVAPSVARAHSAGEPVDVWFAPAIAF